jgi:hypothetical protein
MSKGKILKDYKILNWKNRYNFPFALNFINIANNATTRIVLAAKRKLKITLHSALKNIDNNPNIGHNTTLKRHINVQNK